MNLLLHEVLKKYWSFDNFRENQIEIVNSVLSHNNCIALLPTGGGKSLCYQLPAILMNGVCIVISPLLALMKDQVESLISKGISAAFISSEFSEDELTTVYHLLHTNQIKLLYVSPERIKNKTFIEILAKSEISFVVIDEAHCISEWGNDFRPSYQYIKTIKNQFPDIKFLSLTATATPKVISDIINKLELEKPKIFKSSFERKNIHIKCLEIGNKHERILQELKIKQQSGIIYVRTRNEAENLVAFLHRNKIENVAFYHAGLSSDIKNKLQNIWQESSSFVLISTNAFGMGIDKSNVRFVIHYSPSNSIENFYQEIGRAGRDGQEANALCLWNENEFSNLDDQFSDQIPSKIEFQKCLSIIYSLMKIAEFDENKEWHQISLENIAKIASISKNKIRSILQFLLQKNVFDYIQKNQKSSLQILINPEDLECIPKAHSYMIEKLIRYLPGVLSGKVLFRKSVLVDKFKADWKLISMQLKDFQKLKYLDFIDGDQMMIKSKMIRNDAEIMNFYWPVYKEIQTNKIRKWEEMKFFIKSSDYCRMNMILTYFGEKPNSVCNYCDYCMGNNSNVNLASIILENLSKQDLGLDEFCIIINTHNREEILEELYHLLDNRKIKMLNYKTYTLIK